MEEKKKDKTEEEPAKPKGTSRTLFVAGPALVCASEALDENYDGNLFRLSDMKSAVQNFNHFRQCYKKNPPRPRRNADGKMLIPRRPHIFDLGWQHPAENSLQDRVGENRDIYVDEKKRLMLIGRINGSTIVGRELIETLERSKPEPNKHSGIGISVETTAKHVSNNNKESGKKRRVIAKYLTGISLVKRPAHHSTGTYVTNWANTEEELLEQLFGKQVGEEKDNEAMDIDDDGISANAPVSNRPIFVGKRLRQRIENTLGKPLLPNVMETQANEIDLYDDDVEVSETQEITPDAVITNQPLTKENAGSVAATVLDKEVAKKDTDKKIEAPEKSNEEKEAKDKKEAPKSPNQNVEDAKKKDQEASAAGDPMDVDDEDSTPPVEKSSSKPDKMDDAPLFDEKRQSSSNDSGDANSDKKQSRPTDKPAPMSTQGGAQGSGQQQQQNQSDTPSNNNNNGTQSGQAPPKGPNKRPLEDDLSSNKASRSEEKSSPLAKTPQTEAKGKKSDYQYDDQDLAQQIEATGAQMAELRQLLGLNSNEQLREYFEEVKRAKAAEVLAQTKASISALSLVLDRANADESVKKNASSFIEDALAGRPLDATAAREFAKTISATAMNLGNNMLLVEADYQRENKVNNNDDAMDIDGDVPPPNSVKRPAQPQEDVRDMNSRAGNTLNLGSLLSQNSWGSRYLDSAFNSHGVIKRGGGNNSLPMHQQPHPSSSFGGSNGNNTGFVNQAAPGFSSYNPQSQYMANQQMMLQYQQQQQQQRQRQNPNQNGQIPIPEGFKMPSHNRSRVSQGVDSMEVDQTAEQERIKKRIESLNNEKVGFVPMGKREMGEITSHFPKEIANYRPDGFGWDQALEHVVPNGFVHRVAEAIIYPNLDTAVNPARREIFDSGESSLYEDETRYTGYLPRVIGGKGEPLILGHEGEYEELKPLRFKPVR